MTRSNRRRALDPLVPRSPERWPRIVDGIDTKALPKDTNGEPFMDAKDYPPSNTDLAYERVSRLFDLSEDEIEALSSEQSLFWTSIITAVGSFSIPLDDKKNNDGHFSEMSDEAIISLYDIAKNHPSGVQYTQELAIYANQQRQTLQQDGTSTPASADAFFIQTVTSFTMPTR